MTSRRIIGDTEGRFSGEYADGEIGLILAAPARIGLLRLLEGMSPLELAERGLAEAEVTAILNLYHRLV